MNANKKIEWEARFHETGRFDDCGVDVREYDYMFSETMLKELFKKLSTELKWEQRQITMYGKTHNIPRLQAFHGKPGVTYKYSGIVCHAAPMTESLDYIKMIIGMATGYDFNCVLCNYYQDGDHSISWHADDEKELTGPIVSMSLGGSRTMKFRNKQTKEAITEMELHNGLVIVMSEEMQNHVEHCIPKQKNVEARINLTFRNIK
jgi:alkylated DNA repair dioxygenase AlkB